MKTKITFGVLFTCLVLIFAASESRAQQIIKIIDGLGQPYAVGVTPANALKVDASATISGGTINSNTQSGTGTPITSTTDGAKQGLDVHISGSDVSPITVTQGNAGSSAQSWFTQDTQARSLLGTINTTVTANNVSLSAINAKLPSGMTAANAAGSFSVNNSITATAASTFIAPANARGFNLLSESTNTQNIRWAIGATATSSVGALYEPGRDTGYIPGAANISVISTSGTQTVSVQWILSQ